MKFWPLVATTLVFDYHLTWLKYVQREKSYSLLDTFWEILLNCKTSQISNQRRLVAESCIGPHTNCKSLTYQTALPKKPTFQVIRILRYRKFKISKAHIYTREHSISQESGDLIGKSRLSHTPSYQHTAAAAAVVHHQKLQPGFFTFFFTSLHFTSRRVDL